MKLKLSKISKWFNGERGANAAVREIDLEAAEGEFFVLLGPSGCGKSTLLNLVAGLEKPSAGDIWFDDRLVASADRRVFLPPQERNVAMVFQSYALYPHLTVYENIAFPLRIMKQTKTVIDESVKRASSMLEIGHLLRVRPRELSGGQRQRVAIARAIVREPEIFLLDEPLSNLDAQLRAATRGEIKKLQRRLGITTLYVTHDQTEAMSLGDTVALLRAGRLEQVGPPVLLYERPANTFVAQFLVSPPMNLIATVLQQEVESVWAVIADQKLRVPWDKAKTLLEQGSKQCLLGLRPEQLSYPAGDNVQTLIGRVTSVEGLGRETLIHVVIGHEEIAVLSGDPGLALPSPEETIVVGVDMDKAHFFTAGEHGESLL